jgi:hypothetical protein
MRYEPSWTLILKSVNYSMYISFSISSLRKAVLISLYLINYSLAVTYIISIRAFIGDTTDIYIWSKSMPSRWRKFLTTHLLLNIIWILNFGPFNSFNLIIFILKIYLPLIAFLPFNKLTKIYILFSIIESYFRCIIFSHSLISEDYSASWNIQGSRCLKLINSLLISDSFTSVSTNIFGYWWMNIENNSYLFLLKSIRGIEISIILLLDKESSDSLNKDNIIFCFYNFSKMII